MKKPKYQQFCPCFVCILVPYTYWFSYWWIMLAILMSATFMGVALIGGRCLFAGGAYFNVDTQRSGAYLRSGTY